MGEQLTREVVDEAVIGQGNFVLLMPEVELTVQGTAALARALADLGHHAVDQSVDILARLEAQVTMGSVIRRFPDLELAGDPVPNGRITLRGLDSLPVTS